MSKYVIPADFDIRAHDGGMVGFGAEACRSTLSKLLHVSFTNLMERNRYSMIVTGA